MTGDGPVHVDLQALQSRDFRGRGVARYSLELASALERCHPHLVGCYRLEPDLPPPGDMADLVASGKVAYRGTERADPSAARLLHVMSPFELAVGTGSIWPREASEHGLRMCATVYDLIPLEHPDVYLADAGQRSLYRARLEVLRAADALLTISPAATASVLCHLSIEPRKVHEIGAGTAPRFQPAPDRNHAVRRARRLVPGLGDRFVMYPTGSDGRKNSELLVRAFAGARADTAPGVQLVLVGDLPALAVNHLRHVAATVGIGELLVCTGYVSDEAMVALYQAADLVCFPSLAEGYGLPVAEALSCGAVAVVADVEPVRSLVPPEARFDPANIEAISAAVVRGLSDEGLRSRSRAAATATRSSWDDVADRTAEVYEHLVSRARRPWRGKGGIAVMAPFPPIVSGVADYTYRLVEAMARQSDVAIECFADGLYRKPGEPLAPAGLPMAPAHRFRAFEHARGSSYQSVLYVLGNSELHEGALSSLRRRRGVVLAHEVRLSGLYRHASALSGATGSGLGAAVRDMYGPLLPPLASEWEISADEQERFGLLLSREVIGLSDRFLVTSKPAAHLARIEAGPLLADRVATVPFAFAPPGAAAAENARAGVRAELGPDATEVICAFGIVDEVKMPFRLLEAFAIIAAGRPGVRLVLVGPVSVELRTELTKAALDLGVARELVLTGAVPGDLYRAWLERTTVAVQLRSTFGGEASAAAADCLSAGVATVVSAIGWLGELPEAVAARVGSRADAAQIAAVVEALLADPPKRAELGRAAASYAAGQSFDAAAAAVLEILDDPSRATSATS